MSLYIWALRNSGVCKGLRTNEISHKETQVHRHTYVCVCINPVSMSQRSHTVITNKAEHQKTTKIGSRGKEEECKIATLMLMHLLLQLRFHTLCYSKTYSLVTSKHTEVDTKAPICLPQTFKQTFENTRLPALCQIVLTNAECHSPHKPEYLT